KFCEIFDRPQAAFRPVDLLVEHPPETHRIEPQAPLLRPHTGVQMELSGLMAVHMAIETSHTQARVEAFAIIGRVELLLRKGVNSILSPSSWTGVRTSLNSR